MDVDPQDEQLIEKYLAAALSEEEQLLFEQKLQEANFSAALAYRQDLQAAMRSAGREALKARFQRLEQNSALVDPPASVPSGPATFPWKWLWFVLLGLSVLLAWYWLRQPANTEVLYAAYFQDYPNIVAPIQKGEQATDLRQKAFQLYELKEYREAIAAFDRLEQAGEAKAFYKSLSLMRLDREQEALVILLSMMTRGDSSFQQAAQWYAALAHLKLGNQLEAVALLEQIEKKPQHFYRQQAQKLLEAL
ncbi:MAG: hypothetical protein AAF990_21875 [Bacteroidota bacterium]